MEPRHYKITPDGFIPIDTKEVNQMPETMEDIKARLAELLALPTRTKEQKQEVHELSEKIHALKSAAA